MAGQRVRGVAKAADVKLGVFLGRQLFPLSLVILLMWLGRDHLPVLNLTEILDTFHQVRADQWILAALATGTSFWAVGRYDSVLHGLMDTGISQSSARQSGVSAIAIAQFAGFGVITGALVRWHLLPTLSLSRAFRVSLAVSLSFLAGWAVVTAAMVLLAGLNTPHIHSIAWAVIFLAGISAILTLIFSVRLTRLPTIQTAIKILGLVLLDTGFAALALYALLPVDLDIAPMTLLAVYLLALGAGLVGGTPGGVGPFELCLLALLPTIPDGSILAAALAFRVIYYAIPAGIGLIVLLFGIPNKTERTVARLAARLPSPYLPSKLERELWGASRAELNLIRQGEFSPVMDGIEPMCIAAPVGQSMVMLGDPIGTLGPIAKALKTFAKCAQMNQRSILIYKCSPRTALLARQQGWAILPVAREALLNPMQFSLDGARMRQLRRSIRKAEQAGICITEAGRDLPLDEMQALSDRWSMAHGGENGFSMGVFGRDYVSCQRVFLAHVHGHLVGFCTFHETRTEWCLDLMRQEQNAPTGTMHLLIRNAIQSAAAVRCERFSLAAIPHDGQGDGTIIGPLRAALLKRRNFAGLIRFKSSFSPRWETRYALAQSRFALGHGLISLYRRINKPR